MSMELSIVFVFRSQRFKADDHYWFKNVSMQDNQLKSLQRWKKMMALNTSCEHMPFDIWFAVTNLVHVISLKSLVLLKPVYSSR